MTKQESPMADKKSKKRPSSLIPTPSGTLNTADLKAFKAKNTTLKPNQRRPQFGK
ncbi:MAG TPA: hypothetical protein VHM90_05830 [Phycisphaerae bacterium]|nr:hypothetical protein [Phycisphaerae bacterium]